MAVFDLLPSSLVTTLLIYSLIVIFLLYIFIGLGGKSQLNYPPGPTPLPVIGNLHQLDLKRLYKSLVELSEKYGSVYSVKLGPEKVVVLAGYNTVRNALINYADEFLGRPDVPIMNVLKEGSGVVWSNGEPWKQMRRFTLSTLRDFGMGKRSIEDKIIEEAGFLMERIRSFKGQPFDTDIIINFATANIICSIVFGNRFEYDDTTFLTIGNLVHESFRLLGSPMVQVYNAYPFLSFLPGSHKEICTHFTKLKMCLKDIIEAKHQEMNENDIRSFIDTYIKKQKEESENPGTYFHEKNLLITTSDLFIAGMGTTATTIRWAMYIMIKYPDIQKRVQEEVDRVIGSERSVRMEDRRHMPYTDAVIHEVQRFANIAPLGIPRTTTVDINFQGYFIPKGTYIIPLLASVLYDKTQWEKPEMFNPGHFLDASGKFVKRDAFIPFSTGRRICPGETLAKVELFLFFVTLLQKFDLVALQGAELDLTPVVGGILNPKPHRLRAVARQQRC
ncbi:cytochrome P450 2K1-like isoform X1 [Hypanus sabinus]|uniref:cytochrome P450 2K1-like isoform X1 n=1 Tax=Hypanus sabinus TaxID=79690 RepID=UPI0028C4269F|nr:cytochrome P450 2K1-like isoform X1 [Hypanus sabinus]